MAAIEESAFVKSAVAAFPWSCRQFAFDAARMLAPLTDHSYRHSSLNAVIHGQPIRIPTRIHFIAETSEIRSTTQAGLVIECLRTRSTDGYVRQASLEAILPVAEPWVIPFVVLLAGEYVVEIIKDIYASLPTIDHEAYANFVRENRTLMRRLRVKAASYWNVYYRADYPDRGAYPGLAFLHELERWSA